MDKKRYGLHFMGKLISLYFSIGILCKHANSNEENLTNNSNPAAFIILTLTVFRHVQKEVDTRELEKKSQKRNYSNKTFLPCKSKRLFSLDRLQMLLQLCITEINCDVKAVVNFITRMY